MGCYNQYKTIRLLIHRVQKSTHVTHFGTLWTGHYLQGGGATKWEGEASEVLPLQKSGGKPEKSFSRAEVGGHKQF